MSKSKIGIVELEGVHYSVRDLERSRRFYVDYMGFGEVGRSSDELEQAGHQRSLVFRAGRIVMVC
jgi:4-hydroxyphenylpyruvate dioxygenase